MVFKMGGVMDKCKVIAYSERIRKLILRNKSKKNRMLVSKALKGRKPTEEQLRKMKIAQNSPEIIKFKKERFRGSKNPQWMGNKVSYRAIHMWMQNNYGKANICEGENCKKITTYYEWANLSGKYKRNREDWIKLCKSCHALMDNKNRRIKNG